MIMLSGLGYYCPPPREWCASKARCLDPSNPDTPCSDTEEAPSTGFDPTVISPEASALIRAELDAANDIASRAQARLSALGISGSCGVTQECPIGLPCFYSPYCIYGGKTHSAKAILATHDQTLLAEAQKEGAAFEAPAAYTPPERFLTTQELDLESIFSSPAYEPGAVYLASGESELEPAITLAPPEAPLTPDSPAPLASSFLGDSVEIPIGDGFSLPMWGLLAAAGATFMVMRK